MPERQIPSVRLKVLAPAVALGALALAPVGCGSDVSHDASGALRDDLLDGAPIGRVCDPPQGPSGSDYFAVSSQAELDALEGCVDIDGALYIDSRAGAALDLRPLASLRRVSGPVVIGCNPYASIESDCGEAFARPIPLEGLEALESVGSLSLGGLPLRSLTSLRSLRRIGTQLSIANCSELTSLDGLENVPGVASVELQVNERLESLAALRFPARMERLQLLRLPALSDVSSLASLESVGMLELAALELEDLRAFSSITSLDDLHLAGLSQLTDLTGLGGLRALRQLSVSGTGLQSFDGLELESLELLDVWDTPALREIDALGSLASLGQVNVVGNTALEHLPEFTDVRVAAGVFVSDNTALVAGPSFPRLERVDYGYITISRNPVLERLVGFSAMQEAPAIDIRQNDRLAELDFASLVFAGSLVVTCNRELPDTMLAPLEQIDTAGERMLVGNQSSPEACNPI